MIMSEPTHPTEANMWVYGGIGGAAFATILCVGLFGLFLEDREAAGGALTPVGVVGLLAMTLLIKRPDDGTIVIPK